MRQAWFLASWHRRVVGVIVAGELALTGVGCRQYCCFDNNPCAGLADAEQRAGRPRMRGADRGRRRRDLAGSRGKPLDDRNRRLDDGDRPDDDHPARRRQRAEQPSPIAAFMAAIGP